MEPPKPVPSWRTESNALLHTSDSSDEVNDLSALFPKHSLGSVQQEPTKKLSSSDDSSGFRRVTHPSAASRKICLTPPLKRSNEGRLCFEEIAVLWDPEQRLEQLTRVDYKEFWNRLKLVAESFAKDSLIIQVASTYPAQQRNRYNNILPLNLDLITLTRRTNDETNYINANRFGDMIITQGPLPHTVADFWMMIFENDCEHVVCLTEHTCWNAQKKREEIKTEPYWNPSLNRYDLPPPKVNGFIFDETVGPFSQLFNLKVMLLDQPEVVTPSKVGQAEYVTKQRMRIIVNNDMSTSREIIHWMFYQWPDFSICSEVVIRDTLKNLHDKKTVVHCSAGIGRSGALAIVKKFVDYYKKTSYIPKPSDILEAINDLRNRRPSSVMTLEQFTLIFKTIHSFIQEDRMAKK